MTGDESSGHQPRAKLAHRLGQWLLDDEQKEADLGRLMKYNIVISFLTFAMVAGDAGVVARVLTWLPL